MVTTTYNKTAENSLSSDEGMETGQCAKSMFHLHKFSLHIHQVYLVFRAATSQEIFIQGLMGTAPPPDVKIQHTPGKRRGVFLEEAVPEGIFLLEYKSKEVYPMP